MKRKRILGVLVRHVRRAHTEADVYAVRREIAAIDATPRRYHVAANHAIVRGSFAEYRDEFPEALNAT